MRAIDLISFIEHDHPDNEYLADAKRVIEALRPVRRDSQSTVAYYNAILRADLRDTEGMSNPAFVYNEGEIPKGQARGVREQLYEIVKADKSFTILSHRLGLDLGDADLYQRAKEPYPT